MIPGMNFSPVLSLLQHPEPVTVHDCTGRRMPDSTWQWGMLVNGEWVKGAYEERIITAIMLAVSARDLAIAGEGESTGGKITLTTEAALYCSDVVNAGGVMDGRQSFVFYQRQRYRVTADTLLFGNTNMHLYEATRSIW